MKGKKLKLRFMSLMFAMLFLCGTLADSIQVSAASQSSCLKRNVYYVYSMSASQLADIDAKEHMITHLCYAFIYVTDDGKLTSSKSKAPSSSKKYYIDSTTDGKLKALAELKEKYPWLKVLISLGGGDDEQCARFVNIASSSTKRATLAAACDDLIDTYGLDGIDLDWEEPETTTEATNYRRICASIRDEIGSKGSGKVLTMAVPVSSGFVKDTISHEVSNFNKYLDFWNLMTYDLGSSSRYSFIAPYDRKDSAGNVMGFTSVVEGIGLYHDAGVAYADMNLGVPFYGKMYEGLNVKGSDITFGATPTSGYTVDKPNYNEIEEYIGAPGWTYHWNDTAKSPYLTYSSNGVITKLVVYDDADSLANKISLARKLGIGGMMTWAYKGDSSANTLKEKIADNINISAISAGVVEEEEEEEIVPVYATINQIYDKLPAVVSSKSTSDAVGTWSFGVSSSGPSHIASYRLSSTNGGSLKLTPTAGRYTIDLYVRIANCNPAASLSFDTRVNSSSTIESIRMIEVLDNQGSVVKNIMQGSSDIPMTTSFQTVSTQSLGASDGWIHIRYYAKGATASDGIYIDNFVVEQ